MSSGLCVHVDVDDVPVKIGCYVILVRFIIVDIYNTSIL